MVVVAIVVIVVVGIVATELRKSKPKTPQVKKPSNRQRASV